MINFEYEDVIEYLKADIGTTIYIKHARKTQLKEMSKFKYNSYKIDKNNNKITFYHPKYWFGNWNIDCDQFKMFLRQKRINNFLKTH